jgi:predicted RecA/RadA family phage recombinase
MQATYIQEGREIDYTPSAAVVAGQVVVQANLVGIAKEAIAAGKLGALSVSGIFDVDQNAEIIPAGAPVYWDANGTSVSGTATEGAATATASGNTFMGFAQAVTAATDSYVRIALRSAETVAGGVATATSITGTASTFPIAGLQAAQGGSLAVAAGVSTTAANAGGAVSLTGGRAGAEGVGGAASVAGGIGGSTSGTGGAVSVAGGAGTAGNANGGAVSVLGGNAHGSGTDGVLNLGTSNTSAVNIGATGILTAFAGPVQNRATAAVTATVGGGTDGLIPAGTSFAVVTSDTATKQISLPAASVGDEIEILVTGAACELISAVAAHKVNEVTVGATNELALVQDRLYRCKYVATNKWIVTGITKLGAAEAALVPDTL